MTHVDVFCTSCGGQIVPGGAFCMACGTPVRDAPGEAPTPSGQGAPLTPTPVAQATAAASTLSGAYDAVTGAAERARTVGGAFGAVGGVFSALPGGLIALPWQTITAGQTPDIRSLVAAGAPMTQRVVRASLRRPAVALFVTTLLDLVVALVSAQPAALKMLAVRAVMGLGTSLLGMIVGRKGGPLRKLTGAVGAVTGLVQTVSAILTAAAAATTPGSLLAILPSVISQLSSLVVLVKTTVVGLRK